MFDHDAPPPSARGDWDEVFARFAADIPSWRRQFSFPAH
jgi:hypothetical protein